MIKITKDLSNLTNSQTAYMEITNTMIYVLDAYLITIEGIGNIIELAVESIEDIINLQTSTNFIELNLLISGDKVIYNKSRILKMEKRKFLYSCNTIKGFRDWDPLKIEYLLICLSKNYEKVKLDSEKRVCFHEVRNENILIFSKFVKVTSSSTDPEPKGKTLN